MCLSCDLTDELYPKIYHSCFFIVTYLAPLGLMAMAYFQIFRKLWGRQVRLICCRCLGWEEEAVFLREEMVSDIGTYYPHCDYSEATPKDVGSWRPQSDLQPLLIN